MSTNEWWRSLPATPEEEGPYGVWLWASVVENALRLTHTESLTMEGASLQAVFEQIAAWLLESADQHTSLRALTGELARKLHAAGLPLARVNLGVFALHPEIAGYAGEKMNKIENEHEPEGDSEKKRGVLSLITAAQEQLAATGQAG